MPQKSQRKSAQVGLISNEALLLKSPAVINLVDENSDRPEMTARELIEYELLNMTAFKETRHQKRAGSQAQHSQLGTPHIGPTATPLRFYQVPETTNLYETNSSS